MPNTWTEQYARSDMMWPAETLVRIFKGRHYPNSDFYKTDFEHSSLIDVGCGDACNFPLYRQCGIRRMCGVEISEDICERNTERLRQIGIDAEMRVGTNDSIPYEDHSFDILVSWNAGYYMGTEESYFSFGDYLGEFARVLKEGGALLFSVPMSDHEIFRDSIDIDGQYSVIQRDPLGIRKGVVFRRFRDENDLEDSLRTHFEDIRLGKARNDLFGTAAHWHVGYARAKG